MRNPPALSPHSFAIPINTNTMTSWLDNSNSTRALLLPDMAHKFRESFILQQDPTIANGTLDGSVTQVTRFLLDLIELSGQEAQDVPVLELQLGEILTKTTVQTVDGNYLLITAYMPKCRRSLYVSQANAGASLQAEEGIEYLWHADEGRHIGVRRVPIGQLPDERSVMDAILTTSDQAAAWFSSRRDGKSEM